MNLYFTFILAIILIGCQNQEPPPSTPKPTPQTYLANYQYQEAAWAFHAQGDTTQANTTLAQLENILKSQPDSIKPWGGKGITRPYLVYFPNNVWGLFKQAGTDTAGNVQLEVATYHIDRLLELDLTPITLLRTLTLPNGTHVSGSITYFIKNAKTADQLHLGTPDQPDKLRFFDAIIANADRHIGNWMIRTDTGEVVAIDHNRTFYHHLGWPWWDRIRKLDAPKSIHPYFERFKNLPNNAFKNALQDLISSEQYKAFQNARKTMIRYLDAKMK